MILNKSNSNKLSFPVVFAILLVLIGLYGLSQYSYHQSKAQNYNGLDETMESSEAHILKQRKAEILENSYNTSIELGKEYEESKEMDVAAYKYFDAKSIYPSAVAPRMALSRIYYDWAMTYPGNCWQAKKEVLYALKYVRRSEYPKEYSALQLMKSKLNQKCGEGGNYAFLDKLKQEKNLLNN